MIALISHASKVMLKILQARLQQYVTRELPDVQAGFRKSRGTRDQIANTHRIIEKAKTEKHLLLLYWLCQSLWLCGSQKNWKILKKGISDHLICLLRNLYAGQEATVRTGHGITDWFQIGKGVPQACILLPSLFNVYAEHIMRNTEWEEAQAGIEIAGRNTGRWHHPYDRKWRGTQKPLDESESGEWKSWLKAQHSENADHGIWSHHFMRNRWGNSGNSVRLFF